MYIQLKNSTEYSALNSNLVDNAIFLLFGKVSPEVEEELRRYIENRYQMQGCVALYVVEDTNSKNVESPAIPFMELCKKLHLNPGKKEIIITNNALLYSDDYGRRPEIFKKW